MTTLASLTPVGSSSPTGTAIERARRAQAQWARLPVPRRLEVIRAARHGIVESADRLAATVSLPQRLSAGQTLAAEIIPLADACRFLERAATRLLAPRKAGRRGRPAWLAGSRAEVRREPWGVVLIVGPANYPLLLPGVQLLQALTAGNAVVVKPGSRGREASVELAQILRRAGLPDGLLHVLGESPAEAEEAIRHGVDKVLLTGSAETGREVYTQLAASLTPAVMELSGCDAVVVRESADLPMVASALVFALSLNGGFTCMAPRRVFVPRQRMHELEVRLARELRHAPATAIDPARARRLERWIRAALADGARFVAGGLPLGSSAKPLVLADVPPGSDLMREDPVAPLLSLVPVSSDDEALTLAGQCDYQLGATVFEAPGGRSDLADRIPCGVVVVNDMIVPTADPRLPFGGRRLSGFGSTRGAEGLLELTRPKTVIRRGGRSRPHFAPVGAREESLLKAYLRLAHGRGTLRRLSAAWAFLSNAVSTQRHHRAMRES
jgi:acyl-CoA reductase-like NAD-dependent aldehyde dehydrogenase